MKNLPEELKLKAIDYVNEISSGLYYQDLAKHLTQEKDLSTWQNFISNMDRLDSIRGTNWREVLPALNYTVN